MTKRVTVYASRSSTIRNHDRDTLATPRVEERDLSSQGMGSQKQSKSNVFQMHYLRLKHLESERRNLSHSRRRRADPDPP